MIRFQAFGARFSLPLLTLLYPFLAVRLGHSGIFGSIALALSFHEIGHLLAARLLGVHIQEIHLTPFGGSARMENPYRLDAAHIIPVAAAGPAVNLLLAMLFASLAHWRVLLPHQASPLIGTNLVLFLFNLMPALPLDGGRILFALLRRPLGERRALCTGLWLGRILAAVLVGASIAGGLSGCSWNLSFLLAAIFIIASEPDERRALLKSRAQRIPDLMEPHKDTTPVRIFQMDENSSLHSALTCMRSGEATWFILTSGGRPVGIQDDRTVLRHLINEDAPEATLGSLQAYALVPRRASGAVQDA